MKPERVAMLEALRRRQLLEEAALTPTERFAKLERLRQFARAMGAPAESRTDEPFELLLERKRQRRARER
jgi:hypothetical protein